VSGALTEFCSITKWKTNNGPTTTFSFSEHSQVASAGHPWRPQHTPRPRDGRCAGQKRLRVQMISRWIGAFKYRLPCRRVWNRERSKTQFPIQGHVAGKTVNVCVYASALWGGGESAEIPACVRGQGHRQAVTICCLLERPVQGPSTLEDNPSLSPSLLVFAENFHGLPFGFTLTSSLPDKHILPILQKTKWRLREGEGFSQGHNS